MPEIRLTFTDQEFAIVRQIAEAERRTPANQAAHIVAAYAKVWAERNAAQTVETPNDTKPVAYFEQPFGIPSAESVEDYISQSGYTQQQSEAGRNFIRRAADDPETMPPPTGRTFFIDEG